MSERLNKTNQNMCVIRRDMNELFDDIDRRFDTIDRIFLWLYIYLGVIWVTVMLTILLAN